MKVTLDPFTKDEETFRRMAEDMNKKPETAAALLFVALQSFIEDKERGVKMLNILYNPKQPISNQDISFLKDRFFDKPYLIKSYFNGATPANNYTPDEPYTVELERNNMYEQPGFANIFVRSGGADSPRKIILRQKGDVWYIWNYSSIVSGIRKPADEDPWA